jgi:hypothetical protein
MNLEDLTDSQKARYYGYRHAIEGEDYANNYHTDSERQSYREAYRIGMFERKVYSWEPPEGALTPCVR